MEAEEEWTKDLRAHKPLDNKVVCKHNGRTGETPDLHVFSKLYKHFSSRHSLV